MGSLLLRVLPLALGAAVSPTVLTVIVLLLAGAKSRRDAVAFAIGTLAVSIAIGVAVLFLFNRALQHHHDTTGHRSAIIDIVLGGLLLALAVRELVAAPKTKEPKAQRKLGIGASFALGAVVMVANFSSLVLYLAALKEIVRADVTTASELVVTAAFIAIMLLPVELPLLLTVVAPGSSERILATIGTTVKRHSHAITVVVLVVFGAYLVVKGVVKV
jgi:threonine/homoserine/homoserine lactone efflux protein